MRTGGPDQEASLDLRQDCGLNLTSQNTTLQLQKSLAIAAHDAYMEAEMDLSGGLGCLGFGLFRGLGFRVQGLGV